jgi:predicted  nucleic acid-binding Zn-ribbon protein
MKERIKKLEENIINIVENKDKQNKEIIDLKEDNKNLKNEINEILVLKEELMPTFAGII